MPIIESTYKPKFYLKNGHVATIYSVFRKVKGLIQERERLELPDGDFLDIDWGFAEAPTTKLIIILHGLGGNAQRHYMTGSAKIFNDNGYDAVCINFRSCSGEDNRLYRSYHSGDTEDLAFVIEHIIQIKTYDAIYLKGISLGGNVTLKYLGEGRERPKIIKGAVAISVPCHLPTSCIELHKPKNALYANRFLRYLLDILKEKQRKHPGKVSDKQIKGIKNLKDFDNVYTSVAHGFTDADDYYEKSSSLQFLPNIKVPTLLLNALNDSFLSPECFPVKEAKANPNLFLEMPNYGGHVGFHDLRNVQYNEKRAFEFVNELNGV